MSASADLPTREVVLGRSSTVWRRLSADPALAARIGAAIGHSDLATFAFTPADRVWVLSYSREPQENSALLARLRDAGRARDRLRLVARPRSSRSARAATSIRASSNRRKTRHWHCPNTKVLTVGLMHDSAAELPAGSNIATRYADLAAFMRISRLAGRRRTPQATFPRRASAFRQFLRTRVVRHLHRAADGRGLPALPAATLRPDPAPAGLALVRLHLPEQSTVDYEDIVIGSGLAALGAVIGLARSTRVLVLCGPAQGQFSHYDARGSVPSAYLGDGWPRQRLARRHPDRVVRPLRPARRRRSSQPCSSHFYPRTDPGLGSADPGCSCPGGRSVRATSSPACSNRAARKLTPGVRNWHCPSGRTTPGCGDTGTATLRARRVWVAAGALHTPGLLDALAGQRHGAWRGVGPCGLLRRPGGRPARAGHPRNRDGAFFPRLARRMRRRAVHPATRRALPIRTLDYGIEQRAVFGLPTGSAMAKITKRMSPGPAGRGLLQPLRPLRQRAGRHSIYAQVLVRDAYAVGADETATEREDGASTPPPTPHAPKRRSPACVSRSDRNSASRASTCITRWTWPALARAGVGDAGVAGAGGRRVGAERDRPGAPQLQDDAGSDGTAPARRRAA